MVKVTPVEGWGWYVGDERIDPPEPVDVDLQPDAPGTWRGLVKQAGHPLDDRYVSVSKRHTVWDGVVNFSACNAAGSTDIVGVAVVDPAYVREA